MTASRCEQILAAFTTAAAGTVGLGSRIYRDREQAIGRGEIPLGEGVLIIEPASDRRFPTSENAPTVVGFGKPTKTIVPFSFSKPR